MASSFPLDIAAHTGTLLGADELTRDQRVECRAQILTGHRNTALRTAVVELPAINQLQSVIEEKEIRRASRSVGARHLLRFVVEIGEAKSQLARLLGQTLR